MRVISLTQKPIPDNTQHSQETGTLAPWGGSNPQCQQARRPQTHVFDLAATEIGDTFIHLS